MSINPLGVARRTPYLGGGAPFVFLLRDDFLTAEDAPLASPRTAQPGPGLLTLVQNDGEFSISDGKLQIPAQTTPAWGDLGFVGGLISRSAGIGLCGKGRVIDGPSNLCITLGGGPALTPNTGQGINFGAVSGTGIRYQNPSANISIGLYTLDTDYIFGIMLRKAGGFAFIKGGIYNSYRLLWVDAYQTFASVYPSLTNFSNVAGVETFRVARLPGSPDDAVPGNGYEVWGHRDLDVTYWKPAPVASNTFTHTPDTVISFQVVSLPSDAYIGVGFRVVDSNNLWDVEIQPNGSITLFQRLGGTWYGRGTLAAGTIQNGDRVWVTLNASSFKVYKNATLLVSYTSSDCIAATAGSVIALGTGGVIANLTCRTLDGIYNSPWQSEELLVDGDMEAAGTSAWTAANSALLTKETANPHGGSRVLRVAHNGSADPYAYQAPTIGKRYRFTGWGRSGGGTAKPRFTAGSAAVEGTTSTDWQYLELEWVAGFALAGCQAKTSVLGEYVEWDDVSVVEIKNASSNHPGYGIATDVLPGPRAVSDAFTHEADCVLEFVVDALPTGPSGYIDINFRQVDSANHMRVYVNDAGSLSISEVGGAGSFGGVIGALSGGERIVVVAEGSTIKGYYNTTLAWSVTPSLYQTQTSGLVRKIDTGGRVSNLITWPRNLEAAPLTPGAPEALKALERMAR